MLRFTKKQRQTYEAELLKTTRSKSRFSDVMGRLAKSKLGMVGLAIVVVLVILVIFAPLFTKYDYAAQDYSNRFQYPSMQHIMGTDDYGRDIWARMLYGGRISLLVAVIAVAISMVSGIVLGAVTGYFGGKVDIIICRILDILMAIPALLLAIVISAALGTGVVNTALAVSIGTIPGAARIVRSTVMTIKDQEYVEAAKATGSNNARTIFVHILPNTLPTLIVDSTLRIGGCILGIFGLSFIGLGVQPPTPEWGSILNVGRQYIRTFWPMTVYPSLMIALVMFGFNLLGDGLRDALDPKLKN
ncbi:MAG: ABC transporter permease [Oscillospiraceae bacterium]|nr:ABC transporter permease [Oscillospiraceae bacterium]